MLPVDKIPRAKSAPNINITSTTGSKITFIIEQEKEREREREREVEIEG